MLERLARPRLLGICDAPGHFEHQGVKVTNWRDALAVLGPPDPGRR